MDCQYIVVVVVVWRVFVGLWLVVGVVDVLFWVVLQVLQDIFGLVFEVVVDVQGVVVEYDQGVVVGNQCGDVIVWVGQCVEQVVGVLCVVSQGQFVFGGYVQQFGDMFLFQVFDDGVVDLGEDLE